VSWSRFDCPPLLYFILFYLYAYLFYLSIFKGLSSTPDESGVQCSQSGRYPVDLFGYARTIPKSWPLLPSLARTLQELRPI